MPSTQTTWPSHKLYQPHSHVTKNGSGDKPYQSHSHVTKNGSGDKSYQPHSHVTKNGNGDKLYQPHSHVNKNGNRNKPYQPHSHVSESEKGEHSPLLLVPQWRRSPLHLAAPASVPRLSFVPEEEGKYHQAIHSVVVYNYSSWWYHYVLDWLCYER